MFSLIFAISEDEKIGHGNKLIWNIPNDLKRFKEITENHKIIMGRKTLDSMGRLLPNRHNIILTRDKEFKLSDEILSKKNDTTTYEIVNDIEKVIQENTTDEEIFIIGGGEIYKQFISYSNKIYATAIYKEYPYADTSLDLDVTDFTIIEETEVQEHEGLKYNYVTLQRDSNIK